MIDEIKIAICLSGHSRYFDKIELPKINADYFISTYRQDGYKRKIASENPIAYHYFDHVDTNLINVNTLIEHYNPKLILVSDDDCIESLKNKFGDTKTCSNVIIRNVASMFYKIKQANDLKKQYELANNFKYDFVFRYRFDSNLNDILINLNDLDNTLYIKNKSENSFYDIMYGGNSNVMDIVANCFDWMMNMKIEDLIQLKDAEHILFHYLKCELPDIIISSNFNYTFYSLRDGTYKI